MADRCSGIQLMRGPPAGNGSGQSLATVVIAYQGPSFVRSIRPSWREGNDFFQDWTSARNVLAGRPAYLPLSAAVELYRPIIEKGPRPVPTLPWNAHPPVSVLVVLPLGLLGYPDAGIMWNIVGLTALRASLVVIFRELRIPVAAWSVLPLAALGLTCSPLRNQVWLGQWNTQLLLLLTLAWVADRRGHGLSSGFWVGTAVALKVFPIFFLLYFFIRRRWTAVFASCASVVVWTAAAVAIMGPEPYRDYYVRVLHLSARFARLRNASVHAFWLKNLVIGASDYGLYAEPR